MLIVLKQHAGWSSPGVWKDTALWVNSRQLSGTSKPGSTYCRCALAEECGECFKEQVRSGNGLRKVKSSVKSISQ